jgi:pSer/pThr/pTyr-binding forkhead associated (FHA) protein
VLESSWSPRPPYTQFLTSISSIAGPRTKSKVRGVHRSGRRTRRGIVLPEQLHGLLERHAATQATEREHAGTVWEEGGWMFTQPNGRPLDPGQDGRE